MDTSRVGQKKMWFEAKRSFYPTGPFLYCLVAVFLLMKIAWTDNVEGHWRNISAKLFWNQTSPFIREELSSFVILPIFWCHLPVLFFNQSIWLQQILKREIQRIFQPNHLGISYELIQRRRILNFGHFPIFLMLQQSNFSWSSNSHYWDKITKDLWGPNHFTGYLSYCFPIWIITIVLNIQSHWARLKFQ